MLSDSVDSLASRPRLRLTVRGGLVGGLLKVAVLALTLAVPFYLADCDPRIDDHGYVGDETMVVTVAMNRGHQRQRVLRHEP